jgi:hypothetical protein
MDQAWTVKNVRGKKLGWIKKLIIDSTARQIAYADLVVGDGPHIIRIPWRVFAINKDGILLKATQEELADALCPDYSTAIPGAVALKVAMAPSGRPHQRRTANSAQSPSAGRPSP